MISLLVSGLVVVAMCFIFKKMGREWWEAIIPGYDLYVLFEVLYGNGISFLKLLIPFYNIYVAIRMNIDIGKAFNKPTAFCVGLVLLSPVFLSILAFSENEQYNPQN